MIERSGIPARNGRRFAFLFPADNGNVAGVSAVAKGNRIKAFVLHHTGNAAVVQRRQRRPLAAVHQIVGAKVVNHRNTGQIGQQPRIAHLQRIRFPAAGRRRRKMVTGLPVKTDRRNFPFVGTACFQQAVDRFRNQTGIGLNRCGKQGIGRRFRHRNIIFYVFFQPQKTLPQRRRIRQRKSSQVANAAVVVKNAQHRVRGIKRIAGHNADRLDNHKKAPSVDPRELL